MSREEILVVDDEKNIRSSLEGILKDEGYRVRGVATGEELLKQVVQAVPDLVVLDVWLPGMDGLAGARGSQASASGASGHHDLRPLHRGDRGQGDEARSVRLRRKAVEPGEDRPGRAQRPGPPSAGTGEPGPPKDTCGAIRDRGGKPRDSGSCGRRFSPPLPATAES